MKNKTVAAVSLGCDKNRVDTERMLGSLASAGYVAGAEPGESDIIIVNTCAFIEEAIEESEGTIGEMAALKRKGLCKKLVVAGCLPERDREKLKKRFPEIDMIVGSTGAGEALLKMEGLDEPAQSGRLITTMPWRAYLKISEGCSNSCSYCMIPSIRGPYRSESADKILEEARALADMGVREITIVAQDTTRYGSDLPGSPSLPDLLEKLSEIQGVEWLRLMYAYPELVTPELARAIGGLEKVCNYIDMPAQHISADILAAMKRRGGPSAIRGAIDLLRKEAPDIAIRTTLMVGFPGETKKHFKELLDFVRQTEFDRLGAFAYSREKGTAAAKMPGHLDEEAKDERLETLMLLQQEISLKKNESLIGKTMRVLVEDVDEEDGEKFSVGRTYRDAPDVDGLFFIDRVEEPGTFVDAVASSAGEYDLRGE